MKIDKTKLDGVLIVTPNIIKDERGYFAETFRQDVFDNSSANVSFVQDNQALSVKANVVRGLHFQRPPFAQAKLIRVLRGRILDIAFDMRKGSPTFGRHLAIELSAKNMKQLFIPEGFAHGYLTLEPGVEIAYKVSAMYSPAHDHGIFWADPSLELPWPVNIDQAILSAKDEKLPLFNEVESPFVYSYPNSTSRHTKNSVKP
jgi:dTDP-4-dehydrorhamnose 3,5-epimerase